jgi:alcohol dehydrogenase class IV
MEFEFATAARIIFGNGSFGRAVEISKGLGQRFLVITDSRERIGHWLEKLGGWFCICEVDKEVDVVCLEMATRIIAQENIDCVICIGGGSVLDAGKASAVLATNTGELRDYLEVIGAGRPLEFPGLPCIAVPTTSGTGAEVTRNAVIRVPEAGIKVSLRSPFLLPRVAIVDPQLTYSLPPELTASTGLDALTQLIEPFLCTSPTPPTDALCRDGIARAAKALPVAFARNEDSWAREEMSLCSLFGGMALANARLGAVHGLAGVIGGRYDAPHGAICAALLAPVLQANLQALRSRQPESPVLLRFAELGRLLTGNDHAEAEDGIRFLADLTRELRIRSLTALGVRQDALPEIADLSMGTSSMKGNPVVLSPAELDSLLNQAL